MVGIHQVTQNFLKSDIVLGERRRFNNYMLIGLLIFWSSNVNGITISAGNFNRLFEFFFSSERIGANLKLEKSISKVDSNKL